MNRRPLRFLPALLGAGLLTWIGLALPGTSDLASRCDARFQFQKLGLGLTE